MKRRISASDLKLYNANVSGNNVGDCVKRSMSLAFDLPYSEIGKLLNAKKKEKRAYAWNQRSVFQPVIYDLGGKEYVSTKDDLISVNDFGDEHPKGTYLLLVGKKPGEMSHMVCIRDGKVWDSWDCRKYFVTGYYDVTGVSNKEARDIDKNYINEVAQEFAQPAIENEMNRFVDKKKWHAIRIMCKAYANSTYQIKADCRIDLEKDKTINKDRISTFVIKLTIEPSWTDEEIIDFVKKTAKIRTYDRMYAIADQEKKLVEEVEVEKQLSNSKESKKYVYLTPQEQRFVNTLPGWIRPLITFVGITEPNRWSDSYRIYFNKLPGDTLHPNMDRVYLYAWNARELKDKINRYHKNYEIDGYEYNYDDEY